MAREKQVPAKCVERTVRYSDGVLYQGDCLKIMKSLPAQSVDLVMGSPPYTDARLYLENGKDLGIARKRDDWIAWMVEIFQASLRVCKGLVAYVVGHGKGARKWDASPAILCAELDKRGINLRSPVWYKRNGIMGGGGPDWLRPDMEWIICATNGKEKLPWSDNTACGHPPKFGAGGNPSHHGKNGRVNAEKGCTILTDETRRKLKSLITGEGITQRAAARKLGLKLRHTTSGVGENRTMGASVYVPPERANPGNVIDCGSVGGGTMGSSIAHDNDAPFPERLPDFFIRSFCKPQGIVLDPFGGSGTTIAAAIRNNRQFIAMDIRSSQIDLMKRRIKQARGRKGFAF